MYLGVEEGGIYRSEDRGETWESLNEGLYWDVHTVTPAPAGPRLYATTGQGFYRSDDGGQHWRRLMSDLKRRYTVPLVASQQRPGRLYTAAAAGPPPSWRQGAAGAWYATAGGPAPRGLLAPPRIYPAANEYRLLGAGHQGADASRWPHQRWEGPQRGGV